jgi:hypothetical protein
MAQCNTTELLESAKCFQCLSKKELQTVIAQLLCNIATDGGGGTQEVFSGNYADGAPTDVPTSAQAIGIDTSTGTKWYWYNNKWN